MTSTPALYRWLVGGLLTLIGLVYVYSPPSPSSSFTSPSIPDGRVILHQPLHTLSSVIPKPTVIPSPTDPTDTDSCTNSTDDTNPFFIPLTPYSLFRGQDCLYSLPLPKNDTLTPDIRYREGNYKMDYFQHMQDILRINHCPAYRTGTFIDPIIVKCAASSDGSSTTKETQRNELPYIFHPTNNNYNNKENTPVSSSLSSFHSSLNPLQTSRRWVAFHQWYYEPIHDWYETLPGSASGNDEVRDKDIKNNVSTATTTTSPTDDKDILLTLYDNDISVLTLFTLPLPFCTWNYFRKNSQAIHGGSFHGDLWNPIPYQEYIALHKDPGILSSSQHSFRTSTSTGTTTPLCLLPYTFSFHDFSQNFRGERIVFLGDSMTRQLYTMFIAILRDQVDIFDIFSHVTNRYRVNFRTFYDQQYINIPYQYMLAQIQKEQSTFFTTHDDVTEDDDSSSSSATASGSSSFSSVPLSTHFPPDESLDVLYVWNPTLNDHHTDAVVIQYQPTIIILGLHFWLHDNPQVTMNVIPWFRNFIITSLPYVRQIIWTLPPCWNNEITNTNTPPFEKQQNYQRRSDYLKTEFHKLYKETYHNRRGETVQLLLLDPCALSSHIRMERYRNVDSVHYSCQLTPQHPVLQQWFQHVDNEMHRNKSDVFSSSMSSSSPSHSKTTVHSNTIPDDDPTSVSTVPSVFHSLPTYYELAPPLIGGKEICHDPYTYNIVRIILSALLYNDHHHNTSSSSTGNPA